MTKRPGRIASDIRIDLPYPRDASLRTAADYGEYCRRLSALLAEASA
jgi:NitT/TauT family transport system ATP-binding protein